MRNTAIKFTYGDYQQLPEGDRRELIGGEFYMAPAPSIKHQDVVLLLGKLLYEHVIQNRLGKVCIAPTDVVLTDEDVVQPDVLFVSAGRLHIVTPENIQGAPDLVIEVLSPATAARDREMKLKLYAKHGVQEYWLVDPTDQSVKVIEPAAGAEHRERVITHGGVLSSVLPGLKLEVSQVFESYIG